MPKVSLPDILIVGGATATIIVSIVVIYMLILKITGHSPTVAELSLGLSMLAITISTTMAGFIINISSKVSKLAGQFESFEKYVVKKKR